MRKKSIKKINQVSIIDPNSPGIENRAVLRHLLTNTSNQTYCNSFPNNKNEYTFVTEKTKTSCFKQSKLKTTHFVQFTNPLVKYRRRKDPTTHRWAVLGVTLGEGGQGKVCEITATLYFSGNELIVKRKYNRIAKLMTPTKLPLSENTERNIADHEFMMMNMLPDIYHPHLPIHDKYQHCDVIISKRFNGYTLDHLLYETTLINNITLHNKIRLCKLLLLELKKLHNAGIVHRDMKPENIMIELDNRNIITAAKIIDLGYAKETRDTNTIHQPGTLQYCAPEKWQGIAQQSADIFAMGRIFWLIFGNRDCITTFLHRNEADLPYHTLCGHLPAKNELFHLTPLSTQVRNALYNLFTSMNNVDANARASIDDCLNQLDFISTIKSKSVSIKGTASSDGLFSSRPIPSTPPNSEASEEQSKGKEKLAPENSPCLSEKIMVN